jgi:hypothetical protein
VTVKVQNRQAHFFGQQDQSAAMRLHRPVLFILPTVQRTDRDVDVPGEFFLSLFPG